MKNDIRETNDEIRRLVGELDASLDGIPAEEIARESALKARAKQLDAEIVRLLSKAGLSRETVGADTLPSLRREAAERESERAGREGEAADVATRAASVRAEIAALDADIEETKKRRKNLADRIDSLSAEIRNRFLVEDVWYWIFGDETKAAKERAEGERAAVQKELDGLLGSIHEKKERRNALAAEEADLRRKEAEIAARIGESAAGRLSEGRCDGTGEREGACGTVRPSRPSGESLLGACAGGNRRIEGAQGADWRRP